MMYEPWMFVAMEEYGYTDTNQGLINRVARELSEESAGEIPWETFCQACFSCDVDPYSFSDDDFRLLNEALDQLF